MRKICAFDVNETLLDLSALDPDFKHLFGDESVRREWFAQLIQLALVTIITDSYVPFGRIGSAALDMIAFRYNIIVAEDKKRDLLGKLVRLSPHPEVPNSLKQLKDAGYTMVTITNSVQDIAERQLEFAGLTQYFDKVLSADSVHRLKPAREAYDFVAQSCGVTTPEIYLVASHAWDITGASHAGCRSVFLARQSAVVNPLATRPDIVASDLQEAVDQIIRRDNE